MEFIVLHGIIFISENQYDKNICNSGMIFAKIFTGILPEIRNPAHLTIFFNGFFLDVLSGFRISLL